MSLVNQLRSMLGDADCMALRKKEAVQRVLYLEQLAEVDRRLASNQSPDEDVDALESVGSELENLLGMESR